MFFFTPDHFLYSKVFDINVVTPGFFFLIRVWYTFFHPCTLSILISLYLKWVFCSHHTVECCLWLYFDNLCLLVDVFRLFTINTSIYNFDFNISIYYLFSVCFLCFFLILYFHPICFHIGFCSPTEAMFSWHYWGFQENSSNVLLGPVVSHFPITMLPLSFDVLFNLQ